MDVKTTDDLVECQAQGCTIKVKKETDPNKPVLCKKHAEWLAYLLWILPHIKVTPQQGTPIAKPALILPKDFNSRRS